jgi:hypothetical protein
MPGFGPPSHAHASLAGILFSPSDSHREGTVIVRIILVRGRFRGSLPHGGLVLIDATVIERCLSGFVREIMLVMVLCLFIIFIVMTVVLRNDRSPTAAVDVPFSRFPFASIASPHERKILLHHQCAQFATSFSDDR